MAKKTTKASGLTKLLRGAQRISQLFDQEVETQQQRVQAVRTLVDDLQEIMQEEGTDDDERPEPKPIKVTVVTEGRENG